jgi:hypothetical protein
MELKNEEALKALDKLKEAYTDYVTTLTELGYVEASGGMYPEEYWCYFVPKEHKENIEAHSKRSYFDYQYANKLGIEYLPVCYALDD